MPQTEVRSSVTKMIVRRVNGLRRAQRGMAVDPSDRASISSNLTLLAE